MLFSKITCRTAEISYLNDYSPVLFSFDPSAFLAFSLSSASFFLAVSSAVMVDSVTVLFVASTFFNKFDRDEPSRLAFFAAGAPFASDERLALTPYKVV